MTDKAVKLFLLLLVFNVALACAFNLLLPSKSVTVFSERSMPTNRQPAPFYLRQEEKLAAIYSPRKVLSQSNLEDINATTNQEEVLAELRNWARKDPDAVLSWAMQQPDNPERREALTDACFQIAQTDPARAVLLAAQFHLSEGGVTENLAQQWAAKDLTAAYNWSLAQPAGDQRDALLTRVALVWSQSDPAGAARLVVQEIPAGPEQDEAAMTVLHQWAIRDFTGASAWVQLFSNSALRDRALNELSGIAQEQQASAH
jgi:hypothetical protein